MSGCDVLLVEDDDSIREAMRADLEHEGLSVRTARQGQEALKTLDEVRPRAILLDMMLPVMNGWKVIEQVRSNSAIATIPIVAMTASSAARPKGCSGFLHKPFSHDALMRALSPYVGAVLRKR
jgi:CheY-like chemotaxis protein